MLQKCASSEALGAKTTATPIRHPLAVRRWGAAAPTSLESSGCRTSRSRPSSGSGSTVRTIAMTLSPSTIADFADSSLQEFQVAIMGDLHLEPDQMPLFDEARQQLVALMSSPDGQIAPGARVVQVGDLGGYKHKPGSWGCFRTAKDFLAGFGVPSGLILGNHDLEGDEFETDEENLAAWQQTFGHKHYWSADLGPALAVGLSTVRFRSNTWSVHEVYVDDEQMAWFEATLAAAGDRPVVVFTHAPPMGSGLKVVQEVHVKNRCAWLNHSDRPQRFMELVNRYKNVRLWFSGHFHLSQNYADSISVVGRCAFVQTGVIGLCNRDGFRHSRLLEGNADGYSLYTVDHDTGSKRLDLHQAWADTAPPVPVTPADDLVCDPDAGWLCSQLDCELSGDGSAVPKVEWFQVSTSTLMAHQGDLLVEYDMATASPVGVVAFLKGRPFELVDAQGGRPSAADGSDVAAVVLTDPETGEVTRLERNAGGSFYQVFQHNKWVARKKAEAEAREAALTAA